MNILLVVGTLYLISGGYCALNPEVSSSFLGYSFSSAAGQAEYFTVYGGLQVGVGLAMVLSGFIKSYIQPATFFVFVFSSVLALFRLASFFTVNVSSEMIAMAVLEISIVLVMGYAWHYHRTKQLKT